MAPDWEIPMLANPMTFVIAKPWSKRTDWGASCCRKLASAPLRSRAVAAEQQSRLVATTIVSRKQAMSSGARRSRGHQRRGRAHASWHGSQKKATPTIAEFIAKWQIVCSNTDSVTR
jgi:hypothetical protein